MLGSLRIGVFLASSYIVRTNIWTTLLVIFVMTLTFLNVVVITGILVGIPEGASQAFKKQYTGDILIASKVDANFIENSGYIRDVLRGFPQIKAQSDRYIEGGSIEVNFQRNILQKNQLPDRVGAEIVGIDPLREKQVTQLDHFVFLGEYLLPNDEDAVLLGSRLIETYLPGATGLETVGHVNVGDKIKVRIGDLEKEMTVKGIIASKAGQVDRRVYMTQHQLRKMLQRNDYNIDEIAILLHHPSDAPAMQRLLKELGLNRYADIKTASESLGQFLEEIKITFTILGNVIGSAGLLVASITVFIVIFITAFSRKKYIGILKGIGIDDFAIISSYVFLSIFYALFGIALGIFILYTVLVPYFAAYPIHFPFSEGILVVTPLGIVTRSFLILISTMIAGYIPAKLIVKKPALAAILDR